MNQKSRKKDEDDPLMFIKMLGHFRSKSKEKRKKI